MAASCTVDCCDNLTHSGGLCWKHWYRKKKGLLRTRYDKNKTQIIGDICFMGIEDKYGKIKHCTIFDVEDMGKVCDIKWSSTNTTQGSHYVRSQRKKLQLHRLILGVPPMVVVDHINRNPLDNRKNNLRICLSENQNHWNTATNRDNLNGFKGVWYRKNRDRYVARIICNGVSHWIGSYKSKEDAALAYNESALRYQGEFAFLNDLHNKEVINHVS